MLPLPLGLALTSFSLKDPLIPSDYVLPALVTILLLALADSYVGGPLHSSSDAALLLIALRQQETSNMGRDMVSQSAALHSYDGPCLI